MICQLIKSGRRSLSRLILLLTLSGFIAPVLSADVYWISTTGNDDGSGSENAPFASISHALSVIQNLDTIRVLTGDYFERIRIQNLTGVSDFVLEGVGDTVRIRSPYSGPVIFINAPFSQNTLIRNLFITHQFPDSQGVGVEINGTAVTLEECTIFNNHSKTNGGGIRIIDAGDSERPLIRRCSILNNEAPAGGGLYAGNSAIEIEYSTFNFNNAANGNGGGLLLMSCFDLEINYNEIQGNTAASGAGVYLETYTVPHTRANDFEHNLINRNRARANGGGMFLAGSAINTTFLGNTFAENHADGGGGGLNIGEVTNIILNKNILVNNTAYQNGAGIRLVDMGGASVDLWSNQISGNQSQGDGGGIYLNNCNNLNIGGAATFQNNLYHNRAKGGLNAIHSATAITYLNLNYNFWGFRNISAVQLQITVPGSNLSDLIFEQLPTKISAPVLPNRRLYYFGDGFIEFRREALPQTGIHTLVVDTQIDTSLFSGFNLNTLKKQYDFQFDGVSQSFPAELFLYFDQSELENAGNPPQDVLKILAYNDASGMWLTEPSAVDGIRQLVMSGLPNLINSRFSIGYETVLPDTGFKVYPQPYRADTDENAEIEIHFRRPVMKSTLNDKSMVIEGRLSGIHSFELFYDSTSSVAIVRPDTPFLPGEKISATLTEAILETSSAPFGPGFTWQFDIGAFRGNTNFQPGNVSAERFGSEKFLLADLTNDGFPDLIELAGDRLYVYENNGAAEMTLSDSISLGGFYSTVAIEDLDYDNQKEIILVNAGQFEIYTFSTLNNEFVSFFTETLGLDGTVLDLAVSDFDNNGIKDLCILVNFSSFYQANIYYGAIEADYFFSNLNSTILSGAPTRLQLTDVDGNGLTDVIVNSGSGSDNLTYLMNQRGAFIRVFSTSGDVTGMTGFQTANVWLQKPNDVKQEAVLAGYLNREALPGIGVYRMDGGGQLSLLHIEPFAGAVVDVVCADLTSDGINDIAVCQSSDGIQLLCYQGQNIVKGPKITPGIPADRILTGDLDRDGDMDLVVINQAQGMARWQVLTNGTRQPRAFWVDYRSLGGSGTMGNPFPRINDAISRTLDGDTLFIYSGDYDEHLKINKNLTLNSYGFGPAHLFSRDQSARYEDAQITISEANAVRLNNFKLDRDTVDTVINNLTKTGIRVEHTDSVFLSRIGIYGFSEGMSVTSSGLILDQTDAASCTIGLKAETADVSMKDTHFQNNRIAGIWVKETTLEMESSTIFNNASDPELALGGLIAENNSDLRLTYTEFAGNGNSNLILNGGVAAIRFGGIFSARSVNNNNGNGSGIYAENALSLDIRNSVIADNEKFGVFARNTQGVYQNAIFGKNDTTLSYNGAGLYVDLGRATVINNIFGYNNNAIGSTNAEVHVLYNDFFSNQNDFGSVTSASGNLYANPLFNSDYFIPEGNYARQDSGFDYFAFKLAPGSPLIDQGDPALFNPDSSRSDMGLFGDAGLPFTLDVRPSPSSFEQDTLLGLRWDLPGFEQDSIFAGTVVYRSTEPGFIPDTLNQFLILDKSLNQFVDTEMVPGTVYFYKLAFFDIDGGCAGYSDEISNRLDFMDYLISRENLFVQLGQEDTLRQFFQIKNTGTLPIRMQVLNDLPNWLTLFPMNRTIEAGDSAMYALRFSAAGMPRDTLPEHNLTFIPEGFPESISQVRVQMAVSYRDLLPPKTEFVGTYPDTVFQSALNFSFIGNDSASSTIGTPTRMLRYEYQLALLTVADTVASESIVTDRTKVQFNPLRDGRYLFRVAAIDTAGRGGLGSANEIRRRIVVLAGRSLVLRNVWQMVSPSRDLSQIAQFLFDDRVLAVKHWVDDDYVDVTSDMLKYGSGYWIISKESGIVDMNLMNFVDADTAITINLASGWNQIGNPWAWNIALDSCDFIANNAHFTFTDAIEAGVLRPEIYYNEIRPVRQYRRLLNKSLSPKLGYWMFANQPVRILLNSAPELIYQTADVLPTQPLAKSVQADDILINLRARSGDYGDTDNYIGLVSDPDQNDILYRTALEPPTMNGYLQMYGTDQAKPQSSDVRDPGSAQLTSEWNIRIDRPEPGAEIILNWDWLRQSGRYHLFLYHIESGSWFNLEDEEEWIIENTKKINHLKLYATTDENFEPEVLPVRFELSQNYPNPFNMETTINLAVPYFADNREAQLIVYDVLGRKVKTLFSRKLTSGRFQIRWDGKNDQRLPVSSGLYIMRFATDGFSAAKKMILIK